MGTFYRSKHELVFVFKIGIAPHTNTFGLGDSGRYRTNVWDYAGVNALRSGRTEDLAMHPTVKPVALVADAIKDCSRRGEIVLDPFGGSGTTLMAAREDRPSRAADRDRPGLLRHHRAALRTRYRQAGLPRGKPQELRGGRDRARAWPRRLFRKGRRRERKERQETAAAKQRPGGLRPAPRP